MLCLPFWARVVYEQSLLSRHESQSQVKMLVMFPHPLTNQEKDKQTENPDQQVWGPLNFNHDTLLNVCMKQRWGRNKADATPSLLEALQTLQTTLYLALIVLGL